MRTDFRPERADSRPERADFGPELAYFRRERADSRPEEAWGTKGWMNKQINRQTKVALCSTTLSPLRPPLKKGSKKFI